jgi:transposase
MKAARDTYNRALRLVKDGKAKPNLLLKKLVVTRRAEDNEKMSKMKEAPANIRVRAVLDLIDAFKTAEAGHKARLQRQKTQKSRWAKKHTKNTKGKHKKTKGKKRKNTKNDKGKNNRGRRGRRRWRKNVAYHMNYKSKRCTADSFGFEPKSVRVDNEKKQLLLFSAHEKFGMKDGIKMSEAAKHKVSMCCRLQYHFGRWYFLLVYQNQDDAPPSSPTGLRIGALDPGVRTFQSYYSEDEAGEIGTQEELERVFRLIDKKIKRLQQKLQEEKDAQRARRLRKAWYRANARSSDLATDFHYKTIKFLLNRFDVIIAPKLNAASMLHGDSQLKKKTKEQMRFYRHGIFHRRLLEKAAIARKVILDLEEHGTSMTCSSCGVANRKLGSSKTFCCKHCQFKSDRDINSARNHILKALVGTEKY